MMFSLLRPLWFYRGFIISSVTREFQSKYRNSLLGAAWNVLNPLAMIVVYTIIFSEVMKSRMPGVESTFGFSIYLCAGLLPWGMFAEITERGKTIFIENANLLKKLNFPRLCLPFITVINAWINFSIIFALFTFFLIITGEFPGLSYLALFPLLLVETAFAVGLGICLGVLNVFFRDVGQLFGIVLQFWFWFTPIIYPITILPPSLRSIMSLNPMASLVTAYQTVLLYGKWPLWPSLWVIVILGFLLCILGMRLFRRHVGEIVDEL